MSKLKHKSRFLDSMLLLLYDTFLAGSIVAWTVFEVVAHYAYKHRQYVKRDGYCWVCRSYGENQDTDKWLLETLRGGNK